MTANVVSLAALLIGPWCAADTGSPKLQLTLAEGAGAWATVGEGSVSWQEQGDETSAELRPDDGYAGVAAPLPEEARGGLIDAELSIAAEGKVEFLVSFSPNGDAVPGRPVWIVDSPAGKRRRLAARLAPPKTADDPLYLHLGARGKGRVNVSELTLVREELPEPAGGASVRAPLPPDWDPGGNLDATTRQMGEATELVVEVSGVEFSVVPEATCTLGTLAPLMALVTTRGDAEKELKITGEFPDGLAFHPREFPLTRAGMNRAVLRLEGLLPGRYAGRITVACADGAASIPVHATVARGYPAFGTTVSDGNQVTDRWQLREMRVEASAESPVEELLAQVEPRLGDSPAIPVIHFDGLPSTDVLRAFVSALKGRIGLYGPAWRADRPFTGEGPQATAEALLAASRELCSVVRTTDLEAALLSPVFDNSANETGSPENRLLESCLDLGMAEYFAALAVAGPRLPGGGVLGESVNGRNLRDASPFWSRLDRDCYLSGVDAALEAHGAYVPILTSNIHGPASVDERLDALQAARAVACAAYVGGTGATFPESAPPDQIALTRSDGSLSATGLAIKELSRELAGARAITRSWDSKDIPGGFGESIVVLPFLRGKEEAVLVIWNNASVARPITLVLHDVPSSEDTLTISRDDSFVSRTYQGYFRFSKEAVKANRREVTIRPAPLGLTVIRYRFRVALQTWLTSMEYTPKAKIKSGRPPEHDSRPWWQKLQDWADGKE